MRHHTIDTRMLELCSLLATWSKDKSRKVSAVIFNPIGSVVVAMGWNGFPRGIDDTVPERHERPAKYLWTEHAERNAIYNAARLGVSTEGCEIYIPWYPCADCARAIIQSGIRSVHACSPDWCDPKYGHEFRMVRTMFTEAGIHEYTLPGDAPKAK